LSTVLILERDSLHLELMTFLLKQDGYRVFGTLDVKVAIEILQSHAVDLVTMETARQPHDGLRICQQLRQMNPLTPLMIVSERSGEEQIVRGLASAADDYVVKPYSPHEFLARVRALLRRSSRMHAAAPRDDSSIVIGDVTLDSHHMCAVVRGGRVLLTPRELSLLRVFMENPDRVLSRDQLLHLAWGDEFVATSRAIDVYVLRLRRKLEGNRSTDAFIRSLRGFGYIFAAPTTPRVSVDVDSDARREAVVGYRSVADTAAHHSA